MKFPADAYRAVIRGERRGPFARMARAGLRFASVPYGIVVNWRNQRFDRGSRPIHRAAVPVVSIGNLSLGGTGKTPCVEFLARFYRELGLQVAILSRGYGANAGPNDEALVLEENLPDVPHLQGADRSALADAAVEELEAELLILDDGFQHRRLHRDLDIVLIDATSPPHRDWLFPRGTLREPAAGLMRASAIVITRCDQVVEAELCAIREWLAATVPGIPVATSRHAIYGLGQIRPGEIGSIHPQQVVNRSEVGAFCGIGNPAAFRQTIDGIGAIVKEFRTFPDHHSYTRGDVEDLERWAARLSKDAWVLCTQKDLVKLRMPELAGRPLAAVEIRLQFLDGFEEFESALKRLAPTSEHGREAGCDPST